MPEALGKIAVYASCRSHDRCRPEPLGLASRKLGCFRKGGGGAEPDVTVSSLPFGTVWFIGFKIIPIYHLFFFFSLKNLFASYIMSKDIYLAKQRGPLFL